MSSAAATVVHVSDDVKLEMYNIFQAWALKNYGDSGKTKTVTRKKYNRIVKTLSGEEHNSADNSKFRFWVKAKGFRIGPPEGHELDDDDPLTKVLYVPTKHTKRGRLWPQKTPFSDAESGPSGKTVNAEGPSSNATEQPGFKRVAIVEDFFDIIYNVHVDIDGRGGKHAGQKRTYRAIAETYAFLPREAVTRFLMSCAHCQKRMHVVTTEANNNTNLDESIVDFNFPITTTYLKHVQAKGCSEDDAYLYKMDAEGGISWDSHG
ncbi:nucleolar protein 4-like [Tubulanus polymorphus]|uniref:nucleolar protein 4-like n=1 Tax=Tubulanus polymorphus TaxID=672921 RepID=UPI003DA3DEF0